MKLLALLAGVLTLACLPAALAGAQSDPFGSYSDSVSGPCRHWTTITPSDSTDLTTVPKAIYVGGGGDITMIGIAAPATATGVKWSAIPAASLLPVRPRRILATGTTATLIVGCF